MKEIIRGSPKKSHLGKTVVRAPKGSPKTTHPGKNLGKYLHPSKMPDGRKIGVGTVKMKKTRNKSTNKPKKGY